VHDGRGAAGIFDDVLHALIGLANMTTDLVVHAIALTMKALADRALQARNVDAGATPLPSSIEISKLRNDG
jgi:hypothetical protein